MSDTKPDLCRWCCYCSVARASRGLEEVPRPHLLFEVAPFLLVYQHQVEVIAHRELLVDVPHGGSELVACQEEPDRDGLSCKGQAGIKARDKVSTLPYTKSLWPEQGGVTWARHGTLKQMLLPYGELHSNDQWFAEAKMWFCNSIPGLVVSSKCPFLTIPSQGPASHSGDELHRDITVKHLFDHM